MIQKNLDDMQQHYRYRIIRECGLIASAIEGLRIMAQELKDAELAQKVEVLHELYCDMANTLELKLIINTTANNLGFGDMEGEGKGNE
jgi:hypothetical protein